MEHPSFSRQQPQLQYASGLFSSCVEKVASFGKLIPAVELWAGLRRRGGCEPSWLQVSVVETGKDFSVILEYYHEFLPFPSPLPHHPHPPQRLGSDFLGTCEAVPWLPKAVPCYGNNHHFILFYLTPWTASHHLLSSPAPYI